MKKAVFLIICLAAPGCLPPDVKPDPVQDSTYRKAETLFLTGNYSEAYAILSGSPYPEAFLLRAKCSLCMKDYTRAVREFGVAAARARVLEQYIQARLGCADSYYSSQTAYAECIRIYRELLDRYGGRIPKPLVMVRYAHSLIRNGDRIQGKDILNSVVSMYPGSQESRMAKDLLGDAEQAFYVQFGRFSRRENAERMRDRAAAQGLRPLIKRQGSTYKVVVGYFNSLEKAREQLELCRRSGFSNAFINP